jgi:hypothetical protein
VVLDVRFRSMVGVFAGNHGVRSRQVRMVRRLLVTARFVMLCCLAMMTRRVRMLFRGMFVLFRGFLGHGILLALEMMGHHRMPAK